MEFSILYFIQELHFAALDCLMIFLSSIGSKGFIWIVICVLMLINKKMRNCGMVLAVSLLLSFIICNLFMKNIVARPRPCWIDTTVTMLIDIPKDYSFPSDHTSASFAAAFAVLKFYKKIGVAAVALASAIAFSRMYLFVHFPTDIAAGIVFGFVISIMSFNMTKFILRKVNLIY